MDWKKSKFDSSFETYISDITKQTERETELFDRKKEMITVISERKQIFKSFLKNKETKILMPFILISSLVTLLLTQESGNDYRQPATENTTLKSITKDYLKEVNWKNYTVANDLKLTLPFALKESDSVVPSYIVNYTNGVKSKKSEICNSFSVTIEEIELGDTHLDQTVFTDIKDSYMNDINASFVENPVTDHMKIKGYKTQIAHGSYDLNGNRYNYQNYTLNTDKKVVKIIVSYLQNDKLLCDYADIISKSIYSNKAVI